MRQKLSFARFAFLSLVFLFASFGFQPTKTLATTVYVPDDFSTIQEAINKAADGDSIFVKAGTYYEHVVVNKTVSLIGEDVSTTIIDGNNTGHVINVIRDNVSIVGFTVQRSGSVQSPAFDAGICLNGTVDCTISGIRAIDNGFCGISLQYSEQNTITHNNLSGVGYFGIWLQSSSRNTVSGNIIDNKYGGITGHTSSYYNNITENVISNSTYGMFYHAGPSHNNIRGNNISTIAIEGIQLQEAASFNIVAENNVINCSVGIKLIGLNYNNSISGNFLAGCQSSIRIQNARYTEVYDNTIAHNYGSDEWDAGLRLESADQTQIHDNEITDNWRGIVLYASSPYVSIFGNNVTNNEYGIRVAMGGSNYVNISGNYVANNRGYGIDVTGFGGEGESNYATITRNLIVNNTFEAVGLGIGSNYNTVVQNDMIGNGHAGVTLERYSNYNTIVQNNIIDNAYGICFDLYAVNSTQNTIINNNIIDNTQQVRIVSGSVNTWDSGYPTGGNYWSDYKGNDTLCGPDQDLAGSDGKGDNPYVIDENNQDNYPLMDPYIGLDVTPPQLANWTQYPPEEEIQPDVSVIVTIDVVDESGVKSVTLQYKHNETGSWSSWIEITMNHTAVSTYEAGISAYQEGTTVEYCINCTDFFDNWCVAPDEGYTYTYHVVPEFSPSVFLVMLLLVAFTAVTLRKKRVFPKNLFLSACQ